ncbi:major facilitator superfamily domain-containing protein [Penicillium macrosclerotiorum]|uniref:major facilitator superfamily domain-containing protein n=1 Tax=Penicillium macrosclerotiorum TaxID=303699 RepID=UPI002547AA49|nr:major facilitator superfamily domain-containing protein [Penicillium macrosclerotiorum]KAJ5669650.1 major facilitator superfamily domain-containing protein [Penicillium macrosclerotiorum]
MVDNDLECQLDGAPSLSDGKPFPSGAKSSIRQKYIGSGTEQDPFVVTWIPDDPSNPQRYDMGKKIGITIAVSTAALAVGLGSSDYSGGVDQIEDHFNIGSEVATLGLSLYVVGFALGPMVWAPP